MPTKRKLFREYVGELFPERDLTVQQMATIGRWLRKLGFNVTKEYSSLYGKTVTMIVFDSRKQLPNHCTVKITHRAVLRPVKPLRIISSALVPVPEKKVPVTFQEAINYINELHAVIEILVDELDRQKIIHETQIPEPTPKVKRALEMLNVKHLGGGE